MCGAVDLPVLPVIANEVPAGTFDPAPLIKTSRLGGTRHFDYYPCSEGSGNM